MTWALPPRGEGTAGLVFSGQALPLARRAATGALSWTPLSGAPATSRACLDLSPLMGRALVYSKSGRKLKARRTRHKPTAPGELSDFSSVQASEGGGGQLGANAVCCGGDGGGTVTAQLDLGNRLGPVRQGPILGTEP